MLLRVCTALLLTLGPVPAVSLRPASVTACSTLTPCCERTTFLHHHAPAAAAYICFGTCPSHATLFNIAPEVLPTGAACYRSGVAYKRMHASPQQSSCSACTPTCCRFGVSKRMYEEFVKPTLLVGLFAPPEELSAAAVIECLYFYGEVLAKPFLLASALHIPAFAPAAAPQAEAFLPVGPH